MKGMTGLLILVLTNQLEAFGDDCAVEIRVSRNTITSAVENSPVTLRCPVKHCGRRPAVTWCKLWKLIDCVTVTATATDNIKIQWKYSETEPCIITSELIFTRVSMGDAGLYRCAVRGNVTTVSHAMNVSVTGSDDDCPVEIRVSRNTITSAVKNSPVTLRCPVKHCGRRPAVTWCKFWNHTHCVTVNATDNIKIQWKYSETEPSIITSELIFTRVSMGDAGLYRCAVYGIVTSVSHLINVSVTGQNCKYTFVSEDCWWSWAADAPLIMSCRAAFEKQPTVTWCKQEGGLCTPLGDKDKYSLMWLQPSPAWGVSYLTVYNIGAADSGEYHCHASPAGPCVTGDVLSSPIRLLVSGDVVTQCGRDVTGPLTVGILNIVQMIQITVLLGSFIAFNVYWRLKLSAYPKGRSSPVQLTEDDTSGGDPIQAETENDTDQDYDDCSTI